MWSVSNALLMEVSSLSWPHFPRCWTKRRQTPGQKHDVWEAIEVHRRSLTFWRSKFAHEGLSMTNLEWRKRLTYAIIPGLVHRHSRLLIHFCIAQRSIKTNKLVLITHLLKTSLLIFKHLLRLVHEESEIAAQSSRRSILVRYVSLFHHVDSLFSFPVPVHNPTLDITLCETRGARRTQNPRESAECGCRGLLAKQYSFLSWTLVSLGKSAGKHSKSKRATTHLNTWKSWKDLKLNKW